MATLRFNLPALNEYQWRNLYLKKYGSCTYGPPMPKHEYRIDPCTVEWRRKREQEVWKSTTGQGDENSRKLGGGDITSRMLQTSDYMDASDDGRMAEFSGTHNGDSDGESLYKEASTYDNQLFTTDMFAFLSSGDSDSQSSTMSEMFTFLPQNGSRSFPTRLPTVSEFTAADSLLPARESRNTKPEDSILKSNDLVRLQRETWQLLMDDRIMMWFEREVKEHGRIAANVQKKLLEIVTKKPDAHSDVTTRSSASEKKKAQEPPAELPFSYVHETKPESSEDEKLMQTLEKFSPFFAVISPPEVLQRVASQVSTSKGGEVLSGTSNTIGLPIFSQYHTWRETFEFRQTWRLAPFSFFLIHDSSYNHAQICALYILLDVICRTSHTHTAECAMNEQSRQLMAERRVRRRRSAKTDDVVRAQSCPLVLIQQLTEDILLAYEQSSARTALSAALQVLRFLTNIVLDACTASRFVSPEALRRQCGFDGDPNPAGTTTAESVASVSVSIVRDDETSSLRRRRPQPSPLNEVARGLGIAECSVDGDDGVRDRQAPTEDEENMYRMDINSCIASIPLQHLNESSFEQLFELVYWFVDAPTANSTVTEKVTQGRITWDAKAPSSPTATAGGPTSGERGRGAPTSPAADTGSPTRRDGAGAQQRAQDFEATASVVEAIVRFETNMTFNLNAPVDDPYFSPLAAQSTRKNSKKKEGERRAAIQATPAAAPNNEAGVAIFRVSLTFVTTYIRLHGATWLKELLNRLFNILRRESVLLYLNDSDFNINQGLSARKKNSSFLSWGAKRFAAYSSSVQDSGLSTSSGDWDSTLQGKLEKLEQLICQDIGYVMGEFFSSLHGKRAITRLPQAISVMLTDYCSTVHLHLLNQRTPMEYSHEPPAVRVKKYLAEMRQRRVTGGLALGPQGKGQGVAEDTLIHNVGCHRLAKFILFDCWILPALNNAVAFGYLPEDAPHHLRSNVNAFTRYLKIIVNAPFASRCRPGPAARDVSQFPSCGTRKPVAEKKLQAFDDVAHAWRCNTLRLPSRITGIYNACTGSLNRLTRDTTAEDEKPNKRRAAASTSFSKMTLTKVITGDMSSSIDRVRETWSEKFTALDTLNAFLDLNSNSLDWGEVHDDDVDMSPSQILNIFCDRASYDISTKIVVSEFTVSPSTSAACISNIYSLMSGQHYLVRNACLSGTLVGRFKSSPYLACLIGVLTHPYMAVQVAENVLRNSRALYNALMTPLNDETLLSMMSSLVSGKNNTVLMDTNQLVTAVAALPFKARPGSADRSNSTSETPDMARAKLWQNTAQILLERRSLATTGARHPSHVLRRLIAKVRAPADPTDVLKNTSLAMENEVGHAPLCFDAWWRAMVVALTVKAMNVIEESSGARAMQWEQWCEVKVNDMQKEFRGLCAYLSKHKSAKTCIPEDKIMSYCRDGTTTRPKPAKQEISQPQRVKSAQEKRSVSRSKHRAKKKKATK
ncbi:hypothetical protein DPX39_080024300 [Trypanosoma brucei equiperdum]|uniref:Uncharacterized protein n=1 Tax=Trypanosoma brucei equiperdum TaxID=630700 RepID=A0A3L6L676_9TRYP|nr:hypothetical protein DPX39_080024300 [Trypanosoma brucei equiperdum]